MKAHWETFAAIDFLKVEVSMLGGLVTYYVLIVIELSTRRVHVAGITPTPDNAFMMQVGRNLTDPFDGFLLAKHFLIMDRDKKFTEGFRRLLDDAGTRAVRLGFKNVQYVVASKVGREPIRYVGNIYKYYLAYRRLREMERERDRTALGETIGLTVSRAGL